MFTVIYHLVSEVKLYIINSFDKMQLTLWLDVSWDIDNGWLTFLGSDPKDDRVIADNDASDSDAGLGIMLMGKDYENILF